MPRPDMSYSESKLTDRLVTPPRVRDPRALEDAFYREFAESSWRALLIPLRGPRFLLEWLRALTKWAETRRDGETRQRYHDA